MLIGLMMQQEGEEDTRHCQVQRSSKEVTAPGNKQQLAQTAANQGILLLTALHSLRFLCLTERLPHRVVIACILAFINCCGKSISIGVEGRTPTLSSKDEQFWIPGKFRYSANLEISELDPIQTKQVLDFHIWALPLLVVELEPIWNFLIPGYHVVPYWDFPL